MTLPPESPAHITYRHLRDLGRTAAKASAPPPTDEELWALARQLNPEIFPAQIQRLEVMDLRDQYNEGRPPDIVDLSAVVSELALLGVNAWISHDCGGTYVLDAGPRAALPDHDGKLPYAVRLGPCSVGGGDLPDRYIDTSDSVWYGPGDFEWGGTIVAFQARPAEIAHGMAAEVERVTQARQRIAAATEAANEAFWTAIETAFPEVTTDDIPDAEREMFAQRMHPLVMAWLDANWTKTGLDSPPHPPAGFGQLSPDDVACALRTLGEMASDPLADLSQRQKAIRDRVGEIWRQEMDG